MTKNVNSKMTTNSQLSTTETKNRPKKKKKTKQTRTGTESQKWRSHGGIPVGRMWGKVQGIRSMNGRYKIEKGRLRIV